MSWRATTRAVFLDVDGTLISTKSLISFVRFLDAGAAALRIPSSAIFLRRLAQAYRAGVPRRELNQFYFSIFRGVDSDALALAGRQWYGRMCAVEGFHIEAMLQKIAFFQAKGYRIVLVSGSFEALLAPLRERIPYDDLLCTTPECVAGKYTGELIGPPCIGPAKRDAILRYALQRRVALLDSWAFGDDDSDLPMLEAVGHGVRTQTDESTMDTAFP